MTTGQRLRETREYLGFSIRDVAKFARIDEDRLLAIEMNRFAPDPPELAILAKLYQRPATWLTGDYADPTPKGERLITTMMKIAQDLEPDDAAELDKFAEFLRLRKAARDEAKPSQPE